MEPRAYKTAQECKEDFEARGNRFEQRRKQDLSFDEEDATYYAARRVEGEKLCDIDYIASVDVTDDVPVSLKASLDTNRQGAFLVAELQRQLPELSVFKGTDDPAAHAPSFAGFVSEYFRAYGKGLRPSAFYCHLWVAGNTRLAGSNDFVRAMLLKYSSGDGYEASYLGVVLDSSVEEQARKYLAHAVADFASEFNKLKRR